ncbi:ferrochelatase [Planctomicrobium sp. SH664]|uniref:ferrochelatase n=1 Tax=Planctomicrobium sp. SH664 TaxID=3448125 RepID=UPI003F5BCAD8
MIESGGPDGRTSSPKHDDPGNEVLLQSPHYDAVLIVSFGGPEKREDVLPFLENVLRGKPVPRERLLEVAEHYYHFDGYSPINQQVRELIAALETDFRAYGIEVPIYWGNRNWSPLLTETVEQMKQDGIRSAIAFVTAAYSSYSSCRQYRQNIVDARHAVGEAAPVIDKIRVFYNHPGFIAANADRVQEAIDRLSPDERHRFQLVFTAHSIPLSMANECRYVQQLEESCRLVAESLQVERDRWKLVYQSRSGRPEDPWLEPDIGDYLESLADAGKTSVVIMPIGFLSDHMEVLFDLDVEAVEDCTRLGLEMARAGTVGTHPRFVSMVRELICERLFADSPRQAIGQYGPGWDVCPEGCCPAPTRGSRPGTARS